MSTKHTAESAQKPSQKNKQFVLSKNVYLATLIVIFCIVALYFVNSKTISNNVQKLNAVENRWLGLTNPNIYQNGTDFKYNLLSTDSTQYYAKRFGDRLVPWTTETRQFTVANTKVSTNRSIQQNSDEEGQIILFNNQTGQRVIQFYHPEVKYERLPNALSLLDKLDPNTYYEMALSFDKSYPYVEAKYMLDKDDTEWLWIDAVSDSLIETKQEQEEIGRISSFFNGNVFGIPYTKYTGWTAPDAYVERLESDEIQESIYADYANSILEELKANDPDLEGGKFRIIGAVVTGTPDELMKYQDMDFIRASSLGASTSIY